MMWHVNSPFYFKENRDEKSSFIANISFRSLKFHKLLKCGRPYFVKMVMFFTLLVPFLYTLAIILLSYVIVLKFGVGLFNMGVEVMSFLAVQKVNGNG